MQEGEQTLLLRGRDLCGCEDRLLQVLDCCASEVDLDGGDAFGMAQTYGCHGCSASGEGDEERCVAELTESSGAKRREIRSHDDDAFDCANPRVRHFSRARTIHVLVTHPDASLQVQARLGVCELEHTQVRIEIM